MQSSTTERLLRYVRLMSFLYHKDADSISHIILHGSKTQRNSLMANLDYRLHVSNESIWLVMHNHMTPLGKILWACTKCVHDVPSFVWCLHAERLASDTTAEDMLNGTPYQTKALAKQLVDSQPISTQILSQIAGNIHAPRITIIHAADNAGLAIENPINKMDVLAPKHISPRAMLKSYLICLASSHGKTGAWLAGQLGYSYSYMIKHINSEFSIRDVEKLLHKLPEIFIGYSTTYTAGILSGDYNSVYEFMNHQLARVHNRHDLLTAISYQARIEQVKPVDIAKQFHCRTNALRTKMTECNGNQLVLIVKQIMHILNSSHTPLAKKFVYKARDVANVIPLPKKLHFYIDYSNAPVDKPVKNPYKPSGNNINRIVDDLAYEFHFYRYSFWKKNFMPSKTSADIDIIQHSRKFPVHNSDIQHIKDDLFNQLVDCNGLTIHQMDDDLVHYITISGQSPETSLPLPGRVTHLADHTKHVFTAKFSKTSIRTVKPADKKRKEYYRPVLVFNNIRYNHKLVLRKAVVNYTKVFVNLGRLFPGDLIKMQSMLRHKKHGWTLTSTQRAKLDRRAHTRDSEPVPTSMQALIGFCIENDKSGSYDFTTWGHNYGYVRYCKHQYKLWKQTRKDGDK